MAYVPYGYSLQPSPIGGGSVGRPQKMNLQSTPTRISSYLNSKSSLVSRSTTPTDPVQHPQPQHQQSMIPDRLAPPAVRHLIQSSGEPCKSHIIQSTASSVIARSGNLSYGGSAAGSLAGYPSTGVPGATVGPLTPDSVYRNAAYAVVAAAQAYHLPVGVNSSSFCYPQLAAIEGGDTWRSVHQAGWPYDINLAGGLYSYYNTAAAGYGGLDVRRKNATRESTSTLKAWLYEHIKNPYPTKGEKIMLAIITKMTLTQVSTWFANARRRLKKENKMMWSPTKRTDDEDDNNNDDDIDDMDDDDDDAKLNVADLDDDEDDDMGRHLLLAQGDNANEAEQRDSFFAGSRLTARSNFSGSVTSLDDVTTTNASLDIPTALPNSGSASRLRCPGYFAVKQENPTSEDDEDLHPRPSSPAPPPPQAQKPASPPSTPVNNTASVITTASTKPRIWSLADVATSATYRPSQPDPGRTPSKFQPWTRDAIITAEAAADPGAAEAAGKTSEALSADESSPMQRSDSSVGGPSAGSRLLQMASSSSNSRHLASRC